MRHAITFFYLVSACFGFFSLGIVYITYRKNGNATLGHLLRLQGAFGSLSLCLFLWYYGTNIIGGPMVGEYLVLVLHIVSFIGLYCFVLLSDSVMGGRIGNVANVCFLLFFALYALFLLMIPYSQSMQNDPFIDALDDLAILPVGLYVIVRSFMHERKNAEPEKKRIIRWIRYAAFSAVALVMIDIAMLRLFQIVFATPVFFITWNIAFLRWSGSVSLSPTRDDATLNERLLESAGITKREREMILRLLSGDSYAMIGEKEFISVHTVKSHVSSIYRKLDVRNRYQLRNVLTP